ncbi:MAG TPA: hypothetical protein VM032_02255 [Vicinamibacterales bacterium]|nr:hypothetical protein [Vicinamibacterales bacterium]
MSSSSTASAQSAVCGVATVTDVTLVTTWVPQGTMTTIHRKPGGGRKPGERDVDAYTTPAERQTRSYEVTVRVNDMTYTSMSSADWFWDFAPTSLVINDPIPACVSNNTLHLRRPDGKDYKSKIVRVVRDSVPSPSKESRDK